MPSGTGDNPCHQAHRNVNQDQAARINNFCFVNMLIGVICEVVSAAAATEHESISLGFAREKFPELNRRGVAEKRRANAGEAFVFQCSRIRLLVFSDEVQGHLWEFAAQRAMRGRTTFSETPSRRQ